MRGIKQRPSFHGRLYRSTVLPPSCLPSPSSWLVWAIAYAACAAAVKTNADAIIACTETGRSVRLAAKYRPQQPLYGVSRNETTLRQMGLYWGVKPCKFESAESHDDEIERALSVVQTLEQLPNGSHSVVTGGRLTQTPGSTSMLEVRELNYLK